MSQNNPNNPNEQRGPPEGVPGRGPPDHVERRQDGSVHVGRDRSEQAAERARSTDRMERIEAKLDLLLEEVSR